MRRLATLVVVAALISPTAASGQDYTFGDWARDQGYSPGDVMPDEVDAARPCCPWSGNTIDSLDGMSEFDWTTTPTTCLHLHHNRLSSIESGDFSGLTNLERLDLSRNQLSSIESGAFSGLTNLTWLRLYSNQISSIESGAFSGLTNLEELDLGWNQLSSIESGGFSGLTNLRELGLYRNQLSSIESGDFSGLSNLTKLRLNGNQLSSIEAGDFSGLTDLTTLDLTDNPLSSIESGDFSGLTNLTKLYLNDSQLSSIESGTFGGLTNLTQLDLDHNQLSSIESGDFSGLTNLEQLDLWNNQISSIESGAFSGLTNLMDLRLNDNQISSIESGTFSGLTDLEWLELNDNQISSIESGTFSGLTDLEHLNLGHNTAMTELNLRESDFSSLTRFHVGGRRSGLGANVNIASVSLRNAVVNQASLAGLLDGGGRESMVGIGELDATITEMDLSGIDFADITDLEPLYVMDDLTDLWLVNTQNVDAAALDLLLDNLETIEGTDTEGILYMTQADFDALDTAGGGLLAAWDAEPGHHVEFLQIGDVNHDTEVNGLDVAPFVRLLVRSQFDVAADMNGDGVVNGLDVEPFVEIVDFGGTQPIPEPSTLMLALVALGLVGGWRKRAA